MKSLRLFFFTESIYCCVKISAEIYKTVFSGYLSFTSTPIACLDLMFEEYNKPQSVYLVVENEGKIVGSAGIAPLENGDPKVCELQKMYFLPETRGLGIGSKMMEKCLEKARSFGFEKCYIETMPFMHAAQKLYKKSGFEYLDAPMGNTGHCSCPVWMLKDLQNGL